MIISEIFLAHYNEFEQLTNSDRIRTTHDGNSRTNSLWCDPLLKISGQIYKRHVLRLLAFEMHVTVRWVTQSSAVLFATMVQHLFSYTQRTACSKAQL